MLPLALIPYFQVPVWELGPVVLDPWAILVCAGFIVGLEVARARGIRLGLDVRDVVDGAVFTVGMGFFVGHIVHVAAYNPHLIDERGWTELFRVWGGFSSTGGMLGAIIGSSLFYGVLRKRPFWVHADAIMFGFPWAWVLGRLGCFTAHDHIGKKSDFFLAVDFPGGARHDLGLYEAICTVAIGLTFLALRRRPFRPGLFVALFAAMYAPIRFGLDFLRNTDLENADVRWAGLTPAQWVMIAFFLVSVGLLSRFLRATEGLVTPRTGAEPPSDAQT